MKTVSAVVIFGLGTFALGGLLVAQAPEGTLEEFQIPTEVQFVPGEVIVKMKPTMGLETAELSLLGIQSVGKRTSGGEIIYQIQPLTITALSATQVRDRTLALVREFNARPDVEYAQPNYIERTFDTTPNDPRYPEQWHYFNNGTGTGESPGGINLPRAWDTSTGNPNVVVAVLDTGSLPNHEDIAQNLIQGFDMISNILISNDGDGRDNIPTDPGDGFNANECVPLGSPPHPARPNSWHGTHVAGTIGVGETNNGVGVAGVNWRVSVEPVRVLGKCGGTSVDINDGIRWAAGLPVPGVPNNTAPANVINMSLGTLPGVPCSLTPSRQAAINDAVAQGVTVVVAAGNDAVDAAQVSPASCDNVITVAASDYRGRLVTRYSNFGTTIEIMAPGGDRQRDDNGDGNPDGVLSMCGPPTPGTPCASGKYAYYNGTSMAAPHVAGVAALWLAQDPTLSPAQLLTELQNNALPRTSSQCPKPCGAGLLNAAKSSGLTVRLVLDPDERVKRGERAEVLATVKQNGVAQEGRTVAFIVANTNWLKIVGSDSAVTDPQGVAKITVEGRSKWWHKVTVTAEVDGVRASTRVKVPDLSLPGLIFLTISVMLLVLLLRKRLVSAPR